ncbi:histidyl-tRNA synthetase [Devosia enhydra]|uniref:Histidine--tRNA ligase n=1 Tax=Devosia enhydra TaxID=665118 RepID=A0A1K2I2D2_9HYPH|nr:histidine--tRNA ligase [Devosia enhydra]SFZ86399.1 histidyl-tRNA synthetase [Devosia enhydra]
MTEPAQLIEPRLPRGLEDRTPQDIAATEAMIARIKEVYRRYGFDPVETPLLEYTQTLGKFLPDTDRPNAGVFSLRDDDEQWMSLRYDLTAPLARFFAQNYDRLPKPYRSYRQGYVFRNEKPGPGRFRQFMQFDADTVGAAGPEADAEMCMMMADTMDALGLAGKYVVRVNNRKVLDGVLEAAGVVDAGQKLTVLRAIDKLDKFGVEGVRLLLGAGRKDESGDFTKGAGLDDRQALIVLAGIGQGGDSSAQSARLDEGRAELAAMQSLFDAAGYGPDRIKIDPSVVRGLEYYTGPVFEIELTFAVRNEKGEQVVFGSVGGGGRYDGLVSRFRADPVPATGFSIGVSRLAHALKLTGNLPAHEADGPVVVLVMDRDQVASYQAIVSELRRAGIRAEMYLGSSGMNAQMKYANRRNAPAVVIEGSNERAQGVLTIKDMIAGAEAARNFTDNATMRAARPAQVNIPRADLVKTVRDIIGAGAQG